MSKTNGKLRFKKFGITVTGGVFTLFAGFVIEEKDVFPAHRRNLGKTSRAAMILQVVVNDWTNQIGYLGSHSMLNLKGHRGKAETNKALKEAHTHHVRGGHRLVVTGRSELFMIANNNKMLTSGVE